MDTDFRPVTQRHNRVIIVGGGSSLRGVDMSQVRKVPGAVIIAVNGAIRGIDADYWVTIDPVGQEGTIYDPRNRAYRFVGFKRLYAGVHNLHRFVIESRDPANEDNARLCEEKDWIQTHNSGYAAFNLAYHFEPKKVLLLGIDGDRGPHFYDETRPTDKGFNLSLAKLPQLFNIALPQIRQRGIEVRNGSQISLIDAFPKCTIEDGLRWIGED